MGSEPVSQAQYARWACLQDIVYERDRQTKKWGDDATDPNAAAKFAALFPEIIGEEVGEVFNARQRRDRFAEYEELVQVAAVAVRRMEQLIRHGITGAPC